MTPIERKTFAKTGTRCTTSTKNYPEASGCYMVENKKNMFFLQVFFYICVWIVKVFSQRDVSRNI